jgi:hypothetical protein
MHFAHFDLLKSRQIQVPIFGPLYVNELPITPESQFGQKLIHGINTDIDLISGGDTVDLQD